jgi:hypothetical protein
MLRPVDGDFVCKAHSLDHCVTQHAGAIHAGSFKMTTVAGPDLISKPNLCDEPAFIQSILKAFTAGGRTSLTVLTRGFHTS